MVKNEMDNVLAAELTISDDLGHRFADAQVDLLQAIIDAGSISAAAKTVGVSYKTAWDRVDAINNMAAEPLVVRSAGGAKGGGTQVTAYGLKVLEGFHALQQEHQIYLRRLGDKLHSMSDVADFMRIGAVQTSARNQFQGEITQITLGAVNTEVEMKISSEQSIVAIVTEESCKALNLKVGEKVSALINSSAIVLSKDINIRTSARNKLVGNVGRITRGAINADVVIDLGEGKSIGAVITNTSLDELEISVGTPACAFFKAPSVILIKES